MKTKLLAQLAFAASLTPVMSQMPPMAVDTPHYFGPYPNYANSPLTMPDALVTLTHGGGTGAAAEATINPATGAITSIAVTAGGTGYTSAPGVAITGSGTLATATAVIDGSGQVTAINLTNPGSGYLTPGIKKFIDTLPGLTPSGANNLGQYLPVAVPDTTTYPGSDYYEIAVVQYRMKMHTNLPATLLRGYVQLSTSVVPGTHVALSNAKLTGPETPISGYYGVDNPHYLGPMIIATRNKPVRVLFRNLLPIGVAGESVRAGGRHGQGLGHGPAGPANPAGRSGFGHRRGAQSTGLRRFHAGHA